MIEFSFVIPVYKSVSTLEPLYKGIEALMLKRNSTFEVIFVEDHGSEESWRKLLELKKSYASNITLIKLSKNFGQNGATLCGIGETKGSFIITVDDDMQIDPSEIEKLIDAQKEKDFDLVYGVYNESTQNATRNFGSRVVKSVFNKVEDGANIGSSIRLITSDMASHLRNHLQDHLFINQILSWYTYDIGFVEVVRNERSEGKSNYTFFQLARIAFRLLFLYTTIPLKIMIVVCVISSIGSLGLASYYIYQHYALGQGLGFLALIVVAISLVLASISVMGIYLNRIYSSRVKKPHYAVKVKL